MNDATRGRNSFMAVHGLIMVERCLVRDLAWAAPVPQNFESFRSTSPAGFGLLAVNETTMVWEQFNAKTGAALDSHVYHR